MEASSSMESKALTLGMLMLSNTGVTAFEEATVPPAWL